MQIVTASVARSLAMVVIALALTLSGFAHGASAQKADPALLAYLQAGGSLGDICGDVDTPHHRASPGCEACLLLGAATVPPPTTLPAPVARADARVAWLPGPDRPALPVADPARPVRAPPALCDCLTT